MKELTEKEEAELRGFIEGVIYSLTQSCKNIQEATHAVDLIMDKINSKREREKEIIGYSITDPTKAYLYNQRIKDLSIEEQELINKKISEVFETVNVTYLSTEDYKLLFIGEHVWPIHTLPETSRHPELKMVYFLGVRGEIIWFLIPSEAIETHYEAIEAHYKK